MHQPAQYWYLADLDVAANASDHELANVQIDLIPIQKLALCACSHACSHAFSDLRNGDFAGLLSQPPTLHRVA